MRPLESFSTFSAHGVTKCFIGLATGGRKECTRSVTSCAAAVVGPQATPDTSNPPSAAMAIFFIAMSSLFVVGIWPNAIFATTSEEGNEPHGANPDRNARRYVAGTYHMGPRIGADWKSVGRPGAGGKTTYLISSQKMPATATKPSVKSRVRT